MKKLLYITPHLSTGGLPQYLLKKIETFNNQFDIWCIEWSNLSDQFVVQKNKITSILGTKLITLGENKSEVIDIITKINPDIIHIEEIPETFINSSILDTIYNNKRNYNIVVTTHSSNTDPSQIKWTADKFILVSEWSKKVFDDYYKGSIDCDIWEYPIEEREVNKEESKRKLDFDPEYKHVLNVGLFTPGKNQGELIEIARELEDEKIKFHFVGNTAMNFSDYWEPLLENLPKNCIIHGEKSNVDDYLAAADVFYFTSNFELNPLVVKEALSYGLPTFIKKLETYKDTYDGKVEYITQSIKYNRDNLVKKLFKNNDYASIILTHANNDWRKKLLEDCLKSIKNTIILSSNYPVSEELQSLCDYFIYDKENPLLYKEEYSKYNITYNYFTKGSDGKETHTSFDFEHSWAVYRLINKGLNIANQLGFKKVNIINYDYQLTDKTIIDNELLLNDYDIIVYQYDNNYDSSYCSGFFSSKLESILPFFNQYDTKDEFYRNYQIFEKRITSFVNNSKLKKCVKSFEDLSITNGCNREGLLQFSKSHDFNLDLGKISNKYNCDKSTHHQYDKIYPTFIDKLRDESISILEIGIDRGKSYKVWSEYFSKAKIWGMDINLEYETERGKVFLGDQSKTDDLKKICNHIISTGNDCKLIIDDASHVPEHQLSTFYFLFKELLLPGGVYIIEDVECSYWKPESKIYGYETGHLNIIDYFTKLNHQVNWRYNGSENPLDINTITFGPNCIIITKIDYEKKYLVNTQ